MMNKLYIYTHTHIHTHTHIYRCAPTHIYVVFRQGLTLSPRLECSGAVITHQSLGLLGSRNPPASASHVVGNTGTYHHTRLLIVFFLIFVETGSRFIAQTGLELLGSNDLPASASHSARITGMSHHAWPPHLKWQPPLLPPSTSVSLLCFIFSRTLTTT